MTPFQVGTYLLLKGHRDDLSPETEDDRRAAGRPRGSGRGLAALDKVAQPVPPLPVAGPAEARAKSPADQTREWLQWQLANTPDTSDKVDGPNPYWRPAPRPLYDAKRSPVDTALHPDHGLFDRPAQGEARAPQPTLTEQLLKTFTDGKDAQNGAGLSAMTPSGIAFLKDWEKTVPETYTNDGVGVATIGTGHKLTPSEKVRYANGLSVPQIEEIFRSDLARKEALVRKNVKVHLEKHQFDALVSLGFTSEEAISKRSTVIRLINAGQVDEAAEHFADWCWGHNQQGKAVIVPGLVKRRASETHLFLTGEYDSKH